MEEVLTEADEKKTIAIVQIREGGELDAGLPCAVVWFMHCTPLGGTILTELDNENLSIVHNDPMERDSSGGDAEHWQNQYVV